MYQKYPSSFYLRWSAERPAQLRSDDVIDAAVFEGERVVVTEKMDGENTTMYRDHIHARSIDSRHHASRSLVKQLHASIAHLIPPDIRVCGENMYAKHTLFYTDLPAYFLVFNIWKADMCLSWGDTVRLADELGLVTVPVLYEGVFDQKRIHREWEMVAQQRASEGYVIRLAGAFTKAAFTRSLGKYVVEGFRQQISDHWMYKAVVPNQLTATSVVSS